VTEDSDEFKKRTLRTDGESIVSEKPEQTDRDATIVALWGAILGADLFYEFQEKAGEILDAYTDKQTAEIAWLRGQVETLRERLSWLLEMLDWHHLQESDKAPPDLAAAFHHAMLAHGVVETALADTAPEAKP
jgi:hypothetical protein